jgi:endonuclease/exonuclease/phosphatase family metal-dependent hydrolase
MLLLSRHPVEGAERLVLPSSGTRRVLLRAPVFKPGGPPVDVFCTRLGTVFEGIQYVYVGLYGEGSKGQEGWAAEQRLQAELVAKTVQLRFRGRPSLLAGWMGASREVKEDSKLVIEGFNEKTLAEFGLLLQNASTPQQMAVCTACRANPLYNDSLLDRRTDHVFLRGLTLDDVASMDLAYNANNVVVTPSAATRGESLVPISDHYGLRVRVQLAR